MDASNSSVTRVSSGAARVSGRELAPPQRPMQRSSSYDLVNSFDRTVAPGETSARSYSGRASEAFVGDALSSSSESPNSSVGLSRSVSTETVSLSGASPADPLGQEVVAGMAVETLSCRCSASSAACISRDSGRLAKLLPLGVSLQYLYVRFDAPECVSCRLLTSRYVVTGTDWVLFIMQRCGALWIR
jgi:hypothetical protein